MTVTYQVPTKMRQQIPAVVHVDGTTRPQTVARDVDSSYHRLLTEVGQRVGVPLVLNTSFNVKGEPIICSPEEALRCFGSTGLDGLAIEGFWLEKP